MSKRLLSPVPLPRAKRQHTSSSPEIRSTLSTNFDSSFYDEVILQIFSHLSWVDLCRIQATNRNWSRLALDNQLWKALYLTEYGRTRLRGVRGFIGRTDGREIRSLPGRAKTDEVKDWKWMFRISSNWRKGRCAIERLDDDTERPFRGPPVSSTSASDLTYSHTHLVLAGDLTITASSRISSSPVISLLPLNHQSHQLSAGSSRSGGPTRITALALDQSPPAFGHIFRLASFLSTGEFSIFSVHHNALSSSSRDFTYVPTSRTARTTPIMHAVFHHPLLITLSQDFHLSIYDLSSDKVRHTQTLTSFTSFPPSSLVLSTPSSSTYKLVLAYAIPVYPAHWSVGATELMISGRSTSAASSSMMTVTTTRTTRTFDVPAGWIDQQKLQSMQEQWGRKVSSVADTQTDGKWVVLAPGNVVRHTSVSAPASPSSDDSGDLLAPASSSGTPYTSSSLYSETTLQLYRLHLPSSAHSSASPKLTFVRSLHGQTGPVTALALADGRCVSLGVNGNIWVWDLEGGTGAEVASGTNFASPLVDSDSMDADIWRRVKSAQKGGVVFDERKIISTDSRGVEVRRFDI